MASIATVAGARKSGMPAEKLPRICLKELAMHQERTAGKNAPAIDPPRAPQANSRTSDFGDIACKAVPFQNITNAIDSRTRLLPGSGLLAPDPRRP